jgi:hypothetical protein
MNRPIFGEIVFTDDMISHRGTTTQPTPASEAIQAERKRLAEVKKARKAAKMMGVGHG